MAQCARIVQTGSALDAMPELLARLARVIEEITAILDAVREGCDPMFFYFTFRPVSNSINNLVF